MAQLAHAWHVLLTDSRFAAGEDSEAFARWARVFDEHCRRENWLDSARLADFLMDRLHDGSLTAPPRIALVGFDELTPQQKAFLAALPRVEQMQAPAHDAVPARIELRDAAEEFEQAAGWSRNLLAGNPRARIGVVVPDLADCRTQVDRLFREVLHPGPFPSGPRACHVSLGPALADHPVVAAALVALETGLPEFARTAPACFSARLFWGPRRAIALRAPWPTSVSPVSPIRTDTGTTAGHSLCT